MHHQQLGPTSTEPVNKLIYLRDTRVFGHLLTRQLKCTAPAPPGTSSVGTTRWPLFLLIPVSSRSPRLVARRKTLKHHQGHSPRPGRPAAGHSSLARPSLTVNGLRTPGRPTALLFLHHLYKPASL